MKKSFPFAWLLIILTGCIDELPVTLESDPARLVVDALISNQPASSYVSVSWSGPANEHCRDDFGYIIPCGPTIQNGPYKIKGFVRITEVETGRTVDMPLEMSDKVGMIKLVPNIEGQAGLTYSLEITFDYNGVTESYSSTTKMLPTPIITAIDYEIRKGDVGKNDNAVPLISFTNPVGENFYLFQLCTADYNRIYCGGNNRTWNYSLIADTFLPSEVHGLSIDDGASIAKYAEFYPSPDAYAGAHVRMYSIDKVTYDFYRSLIDQFSTDGGAFSPTPATPKGNISGGALGLFRAVEESSATVYF